MNDSLNHVFKHHLLVSKKGLYAEKKQAPFEAWPAVILFISFIILIYLRARSYKESVQILRAFFSFKASRQLEREEYRLNKATSILLSLLFLSSLSLFIVNLNDYYNFISVNYQGIKLYAVLFVSIALIYLFKFFFLSILAWLTKAEIHFSEYLFNVFMTNKGIGVFLTPVLVALEYMNINVHLLIITGLFICILFYVLRLVRGAQIAYGSIHFSFFHLFLYLCTLEVFPLVVLIKLLISRF